ncbi:copper-binding protein [Edwardsiella ictaluri]|uniref:Copper-binding protein n=1 Tax=Edwardsiella ictaluri TaxID=67780 RepID=A0ABY8GFX0_EDWIC|nr:copper-binding protein [Edwardsiella ictaluri]ELV7528182.1 copper-binding protein [Edwardsiella ictaluri]KMQ78582.1 copper-binding protein [Edwardsiella ictaluri]KOO55372.1 copper-binding protein [Edwardsiella ictaluri]WFN96376.1 copper-binding protein [Edwardsiella ictaluri]
MKTAINVVLCTAFIMAGSVPVLAEENGHQHGQPAAVEQVQIPQITTRGEVKAIDLQNKKITISHPAIPELDWPAMTMRFTFDEGSQVAGLKAGDRVSFSFVQQGAISQLTAIQAI